MFKKILVPIDGSDGAMSALKVACKMALVFKSEILILSVHHHHSFLDNSMTMITLKKTENREDVLNEYAKEIVETGKQYAKEQGVESIRGFVMSGQAAKMIIEFAKKHKVDLITIGGQGEGDLKGYLLGGVSHKVTGLASCPVLVV